MTIVSDSCCYITNTPGMLAAARSVSHASAGPGSLCRVAKLCVSLGCSCVFHPPHVSEMLGVLFSSQ